VANADHYPAADAAGSPKINSTNRSNSSGVVVECGLLATGRPAVDDNARRTHAATTAFTSAPGNPADTMPDFSPSRRLA